MRIVERYYNSGEVSFGISGDRRDKILPLLGHFKGKKVLEVGCAKGYLGTFLKKNNNDVIGIDISRKDIKAAGKLLDKAIVVDLESSKWPNFSDNFDLIIFSEVIEHLFNPELVLKKLVSKLKAGGQILITTPNIVHLYLRLKFLMGNFDYQEETVINNSHVHFFTYQSLNNLTSRLGLKPIQENHVIFPRTLSSIWHLWPGLFAYQFVILYQKKA